MNFSFYLQEKKRDRLTEDTSISTHKEDPKCRKLLVVNSLSTWTHRYIPKDKTVYSVNGRYKSKSRKTLPLGTYLQGTFRRPLLTVLRRQTLSHTNIGVNKIPLLSHERKVSGKILRRHFWRTLLRFTKLSGNLGVLVFRPVETFTRLVGAEMVTIHDK